MQKKAALVIAADVALYQVGDPGEPTQGAGAVAFIIDTPDISCIDPVSYPFSKPVVDFWRPEFEQLPLCHGEFSLECYKEAAKSCFRSLCAAKNLNLDQALNFYKALCFHVPFPKMVKKAFVEVCQSQGLDSEKIEQFFLEKIQPTMDWNTLTGNSYTASLWVSVAKTLCGLQKGDQITAFSYGSGCGAELLVLTAGKLAAEGQWAEDVKKDLGEREEISAETYMKIRHQNKNAA
ncbi:MAG: hydroxymethylglutaryl-CoA synthase [Legionella sp.]